jgi:DNA-binding NtrC family response regulator
MAIILIVEDDIFTCHIGELTIGDLGHHTFSASDMSEALIHLRSPQPIDALFTDIRLKESVIGGFELARQAVDIRPGLRVLYTSGTSINDEMEAMFVEGGHFLQKPYTQHHLQSSVKELLSASF